MGGGVCVYGLGSLRGLGLRVQGFGASGFHGIRVWRFGVQGWQSQACFTDLVPSMSSCFLNLIKPYLRLLANPSRAQPAAF